MKDNKMKLIDWVILTKRSMEDYTEFEDDYKLNVELIYGKEILVNNKTFNTKDFIENNSYNNLVISQK